MKRFLCFFAFLVFSFPLIFSPLTAYATDYGNYCSDTVEYPTNDLPVFSNFITDSSKVNFIVYSSFDECFYLLRTYRYSSSGAEYSCQIQMDSNMLKGYVLNCQFIVYKYDPTGVLTWTKTFDDYSRYNPYLWPTNGICVASQTMPFKFVWCSSDFTFTDGQNQFLVSNNLNNSNADIYANFFDPATGRYLGDTNNDGGSGGESGGGGGSYNDSSFKGLVTELFDHLFEVLLYGEDSDYNGSDVDDSIEWLDDLSEDLEDITIKLNQAPTYIQNGFTALSGAQTSINEFFTGISTAVPILYYGIVGILNIIIIRKIIGR